MDIEKLSKFITNAREKCSYEIIGEVNEKTLPDRRKLIGPYEEEEYSYVDIYRGSEVFEGKEIVMIDDEIVWERNYHGGINNKKFFGKERSSGLYDFLKEALKLFPKNTPYKRGPTNFEKDGFIYADEVTGNIEEHKGKEKITYKGDEIYSLSYSGGII